MTTGASDLLNAAYENGKEAFHHASLMRSMLVGGERLLEYIRGHAMQDLVLLVIDSLSSAQTLAGMQMLTVEEFLDGKSLGDVLGTRQADVFIRDAKFYGDGDYEWLVMELIIQIRNSHEASPVLTAHAHIDDISFGTTFELYGLSERIGEYLGR